MSENTYDSKNLNQLPFLEIDIEQGLKLRQLQVEQAEDLYNLTVSNYDHIIEWVPFPGLTHSSEDSRKFIESKLDERKRGKGYGYGIELDGKLIGHIEVRNIQDEEKDPEIGYWIIADEAGKGITTKATVAMSDFGIQTLGLNKIIIRAHPGNIASNKVAEKAGYTLSYTEEDHEGPWNVWVLAK